MSFGASYNFYGGNNNPLGFGTGVAATPRSSPPKATSSARASGGTTKNVRTTASHEVEQLPFLTDWQSQLSQDTASYFSDMLGKEANPLRGVRGALEDLFSGAMPQGVEALAGNISGALEAPRRSEFQNVIMPNVREAFGGGGGYWGGARANAEQTAMTDFEQSLASDRAKILLQLQNTATQNMLGGMGQAQNLALLDDPYAQIRADAARQAIPLSTTELFNNIIQPSQFTREWYT